MKQKTSFSKYIEFARCADEGVADLSEDTDWSDVDDSLKETFIPEDYILKDIPLDKAKRTDFDWLVLFLYHLFTCFCRRDASFYRGVLKELEAVNTEEQIGELVEIEETHSAVELIGYENQWERLEMIKEVLRKRIPE